MSKFKTGDKVRVLPRLEGQCYQGPGYTDEMIEYEGKEFTIREIEENGEFIKLDGALWGWHEDWFELADKPFTQEDLEVGMLVEFKYGDIHDINSETSARMSRKAESIVAIYRPTETGFERVWTRPEPKLYTLEVPDNKSDVRFYNQVGYKDYLFSNSFQTKIYKTQFTQEEIDNLPNQDLIKVLIKKEVVQ